MATNPAIGGYVSFQNGGRHGSVRLTYAVGRRCTNAVAIKTPVPKWRERKRVRFGTGKLGNRRARSGKEQAKVLSMRIRKRANTWRGVL